MYICKCPQSLGRKTAGTSFLTRCTRHRHRVGPFPKPLWRAPGLPAQMQHKNCNGGTYCKAQTRQVSISLLQPVIEVLGIICGIPLSIGGHAEHSQGLVNLREATQVRLQAEERRNLQESYTFAVGQFLFPQRVYRRGLERSNPPKMAGKIKATTLTGFQVNISTPPEKQWDFPHKALKEQENSEWQGPSPYLHLSG